MTAPITDERLAEIRAGLEGVTPGPWVHIPPRKDWDEDEDEDGGYISPGSIEGDDGNPVCLFGDAAGSGTLFENAADHAHLTRLDPQTVSALLSRLDKAEAALVQIVRYEADMDDHNSIASYFATLASNALPPPPSSES